MNNVVLIGRLTRDPDVKYSTKNGENMAIARFTLAVDRRGEGADYISCVSFGKTAEVMEKHVSKGTKIAIVGRIQTGSYTKQDNTKVYTTDVIVDNMEFCEKKSENPQQADGFLEVPDTVDDDGLPF